MEQIDMRRVSQWHLATVPCEPTFEQGPVKRLSVERDDDRETPQETVERVKIRTLLLRAAQEELPHTKTISVQVSRPHQKHVRTRAHPEARRFRIQEYCVSHIDIGKLRILADHSQSTSRYGAYLNEWMDPMHIPRTVDLFAVERASVRYLSDLAGEQRLQARRGRASLEPRWRLWSVLLEVLQLHADSLRADVRARTSSSRTPTRRSVQSFAFGPPSPSGPMQDGQPR